MSLKIDSSLLLSAVSDRAARHGYPVSVGYLNLKSGEIVFNYDSKGDVEGFMGKEAVLEAVFDAAAVAANPDDWIAIPKYYESSEWEDEEEFLGKFFEDNGIDAGFYN